MRLRREEKEWITNIKKSVVNHFVIAPLRLENGVYQMMMNDGNAEMPRNVTVEEDTILGTCNSQLV